MVGGPPKRGAQIGQLDGEPVVGLALSGAVPQGQDVGFASGEVPRAWAARISDASPRATSWSSANWRIVSSIENRVRPEDLSATSSDLRTRASSRSRVAKSVIGTHDGAGAFEVESPGEHRTPLQQRFLRVIEVVVGPRHRVAQCLVACQAAP